MGKGKHTINDIQKALLSSTKFIKKPEVSEKEEPKTETKAKSLSLDINIDPVILKKIRILAPYLGETPEETINKALNHFLRLKAMHLEKAMQKLTED